MPRSSYMPDITDALPPVIFPLQFVQYWCVHGRWTCVICLIDDDQIYARSHISRTIKTQPLDQIVHGSNKSCCWNSSILASILYDPTSRTTLSPTQTRSPKRAKICFVSIYLHPLVSYHIPLSGHQMNPSIPISQSKNYLYCLRTATSRNKTNSSKKHESKLCPQIIPQSRMTLPELWRIMIDPVSTYITILFSPQTVKNPFVGANWWRLATGQIQLCATTPNQPPKLDLIFCHPNDCRILYSVSMPTSQSFIYLDPSRTRVSWTKTNTKKKTRSPALSLNTASSCRRLMV
jgi:hypothetical protein